MITVPDFAGYSKERATAGRAGDSCDKERYSTAPPNTLYLKALKQVLSIRKDI